MTGASAKGTLRSKEFDDLYFSAEDGLAETRHVFLDGNDLPGAWQGKERFVIAETGFGTGLNFLAVWKLFEETAREGQTLEFISFEKYPLNAVEIEAALEPWADELDVVELISVYSQESCVLQINEHVTLHLIFGDVNEELPKLEAQVDCWFLDGFKPATNPEMWTDTVFENMARLSRQGTTFATFTAAGVVRRGLQTVGFDVRKVAGFGRKREMLVGKFHH